MNADMLSLYIKDMTLKELEVEFKSFLSRYSEDIPEAQELIAVFRWKIVEKKQQLVQEIENIVSNQSDAWILNSTSLLQTSDGRFWRLTAKLRDKEMRRRGLL